MKKDILIWSLRIIAAFILLQTLFFKFTASEESVYIFSKIGIEPWGRIGTGIIELIAGIMIMIPKTTLYGCIIAIGTMIGAIFFHLSILGIEVLGDQGQLFIYALIELTSCIVLLLIQRQTMYSTVKNILSL